VIVLDADELSFSSSVAAVSTCSEISTRPAPTVAGAVSSYSPPFLDTESETRLGSVA